MTVSPEILILDVGHGNCAFLLEGKHVAVIDAPKGPTLLETLEHHQVSHIDVVFVSHADADHIGGLIGLLSDGRFSIGVIYLNPDSARRTELWDDFRVALADARRQRGTRVEVSLTTSTDLSGFGRSLRFEVLFPTPEIAAGGVGAQDLRGRTLSANTMSAVIRVHHDATPLLLLPGDMDATALQNIIAENRDCQAKVLVFPHHGGRPGNGDAKEFASTLCKLVHPDAVVFSIGRLRFSNPDPQTMAGVRSASPKAYIACTQLSKNCASLVPSEDGDHFAQRPASGRADRYSCAGTLVVTPSVPPYINPPKAEAHLEFIAKNAPTALCLGARKRVGKTN